MLRQADVYLGIYVDYSFSSVVVEECFCSLHVTTFRKQVSFRSWKYSPTYFNALVQSGFKESLSMIAQSCTRVFEKCGSGFSRAQGHLSASKA